MKKKDTLFRLIKSLSKGEKLYFRKMASSYVMNRKNNYLKIFDVIERQEKYDEKKLKKALQGEPLLKFLASSKFYLHQLILKSLNEFHAGESIDAQLRDLLQSIEILYKKGLFEEVEYLLNKGKQLAKEYERFLYLIELRKWERTVLLVRVNPVNFEDAIQNINEDIQRSMGLELLIQEVNSIRDPFVLFNTKHVYYQEGKELNKIKALFFNQLEKMKELEKESLPFDARRTLYNTYCFCYNLIGDNKNSSVWSGKLVKLWESNPHQVKEKTELYIITLFNQSVYFAEIEKHEESLKVIQKIEAIPDQFPHAKSENIEKWIFATLQQKLHCCIHAGRFKEGIETANIAELKTERFKRKIEISILITIYSNLVLIYFITGDYSKASKWINQILNNKELEGRAIDILCKIRIINLMIHYEKENYELLEYLSKSTFRYLDKKRTPYKSEMIFLNFIRKVSATTAASQRNDLLKNLKKQLTELEKDPIESEILKQVHMNTWIESKLSGKIFEEVFKKNLLQKNNAKNKI